MCSNKFLRRWHQKGQGFADIAVLDLAQCGLYALELFAQLDMYEIHGR